MTSQQQEAISYSIKQLEQLDVPLSSECPTECLPNYSHFDPFKLPTGYRQPEKGNAYYSEPLEKRHLDDRSYKLIRLANGIEALLISDPETDRSAASIGIRVGSLHEPSEYLGLAHFLEHMLFMGSKKYPEESYYADYIHNNDGDYNAFTDDVETAFYFDIMPEAFRKGLDILAQFFIHPLFDPSCVEREIKAVDSEFCKYLTDDCMRSAQLQRSLGRSDHPSSRFSIGNIDTLWKLPKENGKDIRAELLKFHEKYYSANLMKVVVLGSESINKLEKMVTDSFGPVQNKSLPPSIFKGPVLGDEDIGKLIFYQTVEDDPMVEIIFPFPDQSLYFASNPKHILAHYINHEGPGSLYAYLKHKKYVFSISGETCLHSDGVGYSTFHIIAHLTENGYDNYESVINSIFSYLNLLRDTSPNEYVFDELSTIMDLDFKYKDKEDPIDEVQEHMTKMQYPLPRKWLFSGACLMKYHDRELVKNMLNSFTIDNCQIYLCSQKPFKADEENLVEKWYGTKYRITPIPQELIEKCKTSTNEQLRLPEANSFIPQNLETCDKNNNIPRSKKPKIIHENEKIKVWFKKDDRWWVPKANVYIYFQNPTMSQDANCAAKMDLFVCLLADALEEDVYDAGIAGFSYRPRVEPGGLELKISGYNDKMNSFIETILNKMKLFKFDHNRFDVVKAMYKRDLQNTSKFPPSSDLASYLLEYLTVERVFLPKDKLDIVDNIQVGQVESFVSEMFSKMSIETLLHGNLSESNALSLVKLIEGAFNYTPLSQDEKNVGRFRPPSQGTNTIHHTLLPDVKNVNSSICYYCYLGSATDVQIRPRMLFFEQVLEQHTFNVLRTTEQLGYTCDSYIKASKGYCGFNIIVEGERDPNYLEGRIHEYVTSISKYLQDMNSEDFEEHRSSVIHNTLEEWKNMFEETSYYWAKIVQGTYNFEQKWIDAASLKKISKDDVVQFFNVYIDPLSNTRAKLSVQVQSQRLTPARFEPVRQVFNKHEITIDEAFSKFIQSRPCFEDFDQEFTNKHFPNLNISNEEIKQEVLDTVNNLKTLTPEAQRQNEKIILSAHEAKQLSQVIPTKQ